MISDSIATTLDSVELEQFTIRAECPSCGSESRNVRSHSTVFPLAEPFPHGHVSLGPGVRAQRRLYECTECSLWYYSHVPTKEMLRSLLDQPQLVTRWSPGDRRGFRGARAAISEFIGTSGRALDVGAHTGGFLDTLGSGWHKTALDPMVCSTSQIKGDVEVINSFLEDATLPTEGFDCISAFDVFEHLYSPREAVSRMAHALRPGGIAIIETGTTDCVGARVLGAGWYYLSLLEHYQAFSEKSLGHLFERHGLRPLQTRRVYHGDYAWKQKAFHSLKFSVYTSLTVGGRPDAWRFLWKRLRPGATGTPPISGSFEPDHMFMVFQKV